MEDKVNSTYSKYIEIRDLFLEDKNLEKAEDRFNKIEPTVNYDIAGLYFQGIDELERMIARKKWADQIVNLQLTSPEKDPVMWKMISMFYGSIVLNEEYGHSYRQELRIMAQEKLGEEKYKKLFESMLNAQKEIIEKCIETSLIKGVNRAKEYITFVKLSSENTEFHNEIIEIVDKIANEKKVID